MEFEILLIFVLIGKSQCQESRSEEVNEIEFDLLSALNARSDETHFSFEYKEKIYSIFNEKIDYSPYIQPGFLIDNTLQWPLCEDKPCSHEVKFEISLNDIKFIRSTAQSEYYKTVIFLSMTWQDDGLRPEQSDSFKNEIKINIKNVKNKIWIPSFRFMGSKGSHLSVSLLEFPCTLYINENASLCMCKPIFEVLLSCNFNRQKDPFAPRICEIILAPIVSYSNSFHFTLVSEVVENYKSHTGDYDVNLVNVSFVECDGYVEEEVKCQALRITLETHQKFWLYFPTYLRSSMLMLFAVASLWLPYDHIARIILAICPFAAFNYMFLFKSEYMFDASLESTSLLQKWIIFCMLVTAFAAGEFLIVLIIKGIPSKLFSEAEEKSKEMHQIANELAKNARLGKAVYVTSNFSH
ncbi:hypothetical protein B4U79_18307 [Dinothrombium tinctorium]|uniref:Neurotransmitter-gated ion-channel ligand-binding domain-containing protein n=1 Tax=Dinothrombium tinctorium TaxID=1965070 RepID=A0A443QRI1_9ACAR|nr:hypothetical protein B4U79_18307 [Dinothrombium tinctorium]